MNSMIASPPGQVPADLRAALFDAPPEVGRAWDGPAFQIAELSIERGGPPMFRMEGTIAAPLRLVAAMVRESDLGTLAGALARWDVLESETSAPFRQRVFYVSKLPRPLRDRAFYIGSWIERPRPDSFGILSTSLVPDGSVSADLGNAVWGEVALSGYHLVPVEPRRTWLRRVIGIELGLPLPRLLQRQMLKRVYRANYEWMNDAARSDLRRFEARMAKDPLYASLPESRG